MIKVLITKTISTKREVITQIIVKGHTLKKNESVEPLCAAVSAITLGSVNTFIDLKLINQDLIIENKSGYLKIIDHKPTKTKQLLFLQMLVQLKTVANYFQKGITISEEVVKT